MRRSLFLSFEIEEAQFSSGTAYLLTFEAPEMEVDDDDEMDYRSFMAVKVCKKANCILIADGTFENYDPHLQIEVLSGISSKFTNLVDQGKLTPASAALPEHDAKTIKNKS